MLYSNIRMIIFRINSKYNRKRIIFYNQASCFLNLLKKHFQSRFIKYPASLFPEIFSEIDTSYYDSPSLNFKFIIIFKIQGSSYNGFNLQS